MSTITRTYPLTIKLKDVSIMPKKGTVTGAPLRQSNRGRRGGLTGSKRFETPEATTETLTPEQQTDARARERVKQHFEQVSNVVGNVASTVETVANGIKSVRRAATGGSPLVTGEANAVLEQAKQLGASYGLEPIDLASELSGDPYKASDTIPQMEAKDANRERLTIQKQNNALEVRLDRTKQKRKVAAIHKEELNLIGDLADIRATGFDVAKKFVRSEIAHTDFRTEQSKLEELEELEIQQINRTQGVINLTNELKREWDLKLEKQTRSNERLEIEIQGAINDNQRRRDELDALLIQN